MAFVVEAASTVALVKLLLLAQFGNIFVPAVDLASTDVTRMRFRGNESRGRREDSHHRQARRPEWGIIPGMQPPGRAFTGFLEGCG